MNNEALKERISSWIRNIPVNRGEATVEDAGRFTSLFNSLYSRCIRPDYYLWRFNDPAAASALFVHREADLFSGAAGRQLCLMQSGARTFNSALYVDVMVARARQKSGLMFTALDRAIEASARESGAVAAFLFPNPNGARAWLADPSWNNLEPRITWVCATRPTRREVDLRRVDQFGEWVDTIAEGFCRRHPTLAGVKRSCAYLNWRFVRHPQHRYDIFALLRGGTPVSYIVLKSFKDPMSGVVTGDIVDILWTEAGAPQLGDLLEFALGFFHGQGVAQASMWLQNNTALDEIGAAVGFKPASRKRHFLCKVFDEDFRWLECGSRWFLTMADSEIY